MNPSYNPNSLWKKFVLKGIDLLNDNGQMIAIHPYSWRDSSTHKKLYNHLKEHISELHITDFNSFPGVGIKTDWYLYNKQKINSTIITYSDGYTEILNLDKIDKILRIPQNSIEFSIFSKIFNIKNNGIIMEKGFNDAYKNNSVNGKYKQCGGPKKGTTWVDNDFLLTDLPTKHQFDNKIVIVYAGKPRAKYFKSQDEIGICVANYWLMDNINAKPESICLLLNSELFWNMCRTLMDGKNINITRKIPSWLLKSINFDNLTVQTEEELYKHYNLTQEEINFIENEK